MTFCIKLEMTKICLEGDTHIIAKAVTSKEEICTKYGVVIKDARRLLLEREYWIIDFVYRKAKSVAHKLAKLVLSIGEERV